MDDVDAEFRHIQLDPGPRLQPLRLDRMFVRAQEWGESQPTSTPSSSSLIIRVPSPGPARHRAIFPLPKPHACPESPLGGLFDYPEFLPLILGHFEHPRELAVLARVCRTWCDFARRKLYEHIWVRPWEDGCHFKLVKLFDTLHRNEGLCKLVRRLDVRFFPLSARGGERYDLDDQVRTALKQMENLQSLVWTRDKSLTPELVEVVSDHPTLRSLEISGHSYRYYEPKSIGRSPNLDELRVMMPDINLRDKLVGIIKTLDQRSRGGLKSLGIICRSSPLIDDEILKAAAPSLGRLRRLTLWGCTRVTRVFIYKILEVASDLQELSLDALPHSDLMDLSKAPDLSRLQTLSMSFTCTIKTAMLAKEDLPSFPPLPNLHSLHMTLSGEKRNLSPGSLEKIATEIPLSQLKRLSLLNLVINSNQLSSILTQCSELEELFISIQDRQTLFECKDLTKCDLKVLHVNAPESGVSSEDLLSLAQGIPGLEQVGSGNRVYEVWRRLGDDDEKVVELSRWGRTSIPAYFQIWRG